MSVDSFIQTRVSVDTGSEHSSGVGVMHHGAQGVHGPHGASGNLRNAEPAIDPRWGMPVPGAPADQHAFFKSIANELADGDRQEINFTSSQPGGDRGGKMMSDSEDHSHSAGSRRTSMLTRRLKHGKTSSSMNRSVAGGSNHATGLSLGSGSTSTTALDSRSSLSTSSAATLNSTKRAAVSSSGYPALPTSPPPVPSPATAPIHTSTTSSGSGQISNVSITNGSNRRGNTPGPIHVSRQRTLSLGGTAASSSAANIPATAGPLRVATDETSSSTMTTPMIPNLDDTSEYCIAFVGAKSCGKSTLIRKVIKSYPTVETTSFQAGEFAVNSTTVQVTVTNALRPIRILEVDTSAVEYPGNLWPQELPRADGILLCYDASNEDTYTRIPELVAGYHALGQAVVILACKSDLHKVVSPSRADACGKPYEIGLVEVSAVTDIGKKKLRACFNWEIKAIGRHRRSGNALSGPYRNPASPGVLQTSHAPWDPKAIASATPPLTQSSSSSSIAPRHPNNSAPALPNLDTYSLTTTSAAPSTARTSMDSNLGTSTTPMTPSRRRSPSLPSSPAGVQARTAADTFSPMDTRGSQTIATTSATPSPIPGPAAGNNLDQVQTSTSAVPPARNASSSSIQQNSTLNNLPAPATPVTATAPTTSIGGGGGPVPDGSRNQRESSSLQWATLDEILDKLLFVSVSGDDPVFIQHFFLTYRRFATPRSVLLGMQKRMRQLGQETRDPLLAKFAQMRICNLLSQWKENYPTDFGAPGTFGALSALLKQIVSNVHLVHYASDLLPFLEEVPKLIDRETSWAKKDEVGDDTDSESMAGTDEEEILPDLHDDEDTYVGKGKAFEKRTPVSSNPAPPASAATDNRPYPPKASSSAPNVATITNPSPPIPTLSAPKPPLPSAGLSNDLHESVITMDRPLTRTSRVNIRDLRNTATYIIQTEPVHTAQEITRRMLILFKRIEARDWLRRTLSTKGYDKEHDAIGQLGRLFNYLCCWVSAMIVAFDRPQARARVVDKMILIAKALRQLNNYMGMKAFVAGINSVRGNDDEELTQIIASKPNSNWKQFQSLHLLLGSARMGQAYRLALKHTVGPAIPDLERHGSDLLRTNEANLDYNPQDSNLIHWGKFTIMGKLVGTVTLYQNRCHTMPDYRDLEDRPHISNLVFGQVVWDYDTLMNREARALEEAQTTESSGGLRRLLPSFKV